MTKRRVAERIICAFQFLIGRLETLFSGIGGLDLAAFQFLIGRLETHDSHTGRQFQIAFQFLIGRLETSMTRIISIAASGFNSS